MDQGMNAIFGLGKLDAEKDAEAAARKKKDPFEREPEVIMSGLKQAGVIAGTAASVFGMGGAAATYAGATALGAGLTGAGTLMSVGGLPLAAAIGGYEFGKWADGKLGLSDGASNVMAGHMDDRTRSAIGTERQIVRGAAGIELTENQQKRSNPAEYYAEKTRREVYRAKQRALGHYAA